MRRWQTALDPPAPLPMTRHLPTAIETSRLRLRAFDPDAPDDLRFVVELTTQPSFLTNIGERNAHDAAGAARYLREGPLASYERHGFGLMRVALRATDEPIGMCGLLKRDYLEHPDIGYALLDRHAGRGYALEAARATVENGWAVHGLQRILASTVLDNRSSISVLEKLGMQFEGIVQLPAHEAASRMFALSRPAAATGRGDSGSVIR
jgi:[ribosomal protein S5]-alanine N-acetyltransferase